MKVLHITNNYPTEKHPIFGIFVKEQIDSLIALGINCEVFFINGREKGRLEYIRSIIRLRILLKSNQYDVVHCHHALSAICLILSNKTRPFKTILSYQNHPKNELGMRIFWFIKKKIMNVIFKSKVTFAKDDSSFFLPNGVDLNIFKPTDKLEARKKLSLENDLIYVIFVSSNLMRKQKRYDKFTKTLEILQHKYGYKDLRELLVMNVKRESIPDFYNAADIHLLSSDFEGSPNSVKECMACNTPVVSTSVGNINELFNETKGYYVSKDGGAEDLALLVDKALNEKNCEGRKRIENLELDMKSVAEKLEKIYLKLD